MPLRIAAGSIPGSTERDSEMRKEHQMKHLRALLPAVLAIALCVAVGSALAAAPKPKTVTFKGTYAGTVNEKVDGQSVTGLTTGTGTSTAVGKGKLLGTANGTTANPPCSPLSGSGTLTGTKGNVKLLLLPTARGCAASADDQNNISVYGDAKVTGGTKLFAKAKGKLHFSGTYDRQGFKFSLKFTGKLTY
jgi:hypothetical protein